MTKELRNQIEGMAGQYGSDFLDAYQCNDWGVTAQQFAELLIQSFTKEIMTIARELDNERWDDE